MKSDWDIKRRNSVIVDVVQKVYPKMKYIQSRRYDLEYVRQELSDTNTLGEYYMNKFAVNPTLDSPKYVMVYPIGQAKEYKWETIKDKSGNYCLFLPNRLKQCLKTIYDSDGNKIREYLQELDSHSIFFSSDRKNKQSNANWKSFQNNINKVSLSTNIDIQTCKYELSNYFLEVVNPLFDGIDQLSKNHPATDTEPKNHLATDCKHKVQSKNHLATDTEPKNHLATDSIHSVDSKRVAVSPSLLSIEVKDNNISHNRVFSLPTDNNRDDSHTIDELSDKDTSNRVFSQQSDDNSKQDNEEPEMGTEEWYDWLKK